MKGFSVVAQSRMEKSSTVVSGSDVIGDMNREKQSIINELSSLSGETAPKASCLQYIPKDVKVGCRVEIDAKKAPVLISV